MRKQYLVLEDLMLPSKTADSNMVDTRWARTSGGHRDGAGIGGETGAGAGQATFWQLGYKSPDGFGRPVTVSAGPGQVAGGIVQFDLGTWRRTNPGRPVKSRVRYEK